MVLLDNTVGLRSPALYTPKRFHQAHGHLWRCATERGSREAWAKRRHHLDLFSRNQQKIHRRFIAVCFHMELG
jgi:hypothetical protein